MSKKIFPVLAFLLILSNTNISAQESAENLTLTLDDALKIALSENPSVIVAGQEIEKRKYAKKGAIAQLLPQIAATAEYNRTLKKQVMYMGGGEGEGLSSMLNAPIELYTKPLYDALGLIPPTPPAGDTSGGDGGMKMGLDNNWSGGFTLSLPIYAPTLYKSIKISSIDIELAVEQSRASRQDMVNQVSKAYYQLLLAQDSYEVLLQGYKQAEDNFNVVNNKYLQGAVSEYDKIRAEVQVRNLNPGLLQAKNAIALTKLQLKVLIGMDSTRDISISGQLSDYESDLYAEYLKADTTLLANNTDLRQMDLQAQMLKKNYELDKAAFLPTISLSGILQWMAMNDDFKFNNYKWNPYSTVGVTISLPLFTGGSRIYKAKQSKIQMQQLDWNIIDLRRNLNMQVENNINNMQVSVEQLASNKENVKQAEKGRNIAQKRYEVGKGTILELNDSELALTQSKLTYTQAIFDFLVAKTDLDKLLGKENYVE